MFSAEDGWQLFPAIGTTFITHNIPLGYYHDCKDAFDQGQTCSGIYTIKPENTSFSVIVNLPFDVYCDMATDGGGWTVFQRRTNGTQNFYCNWDDYVSGFGDVSGEFWLGLQKIRRLTASSTQLRVELADFNGNEKYAKYSTFSVGDDDYKFRLTVSGYSGTAGDSLTYHNNQRFSTKDQDNDDRSDDHCAQRYTGAWWYRDCGYSNLNAGYYSGPNSPYKKGVVWESWKGLSYSLKATEMKVRRV